MKRITMIIIAAFSAFSSIGQNTLEEGDRCFDNGNYACAEAKYSEVFKSATGADKNSADIGLSRARWCADHINAADQAFKNENYKLAIENYEGVLESNPKDTYAKSQIAKCKNILYPPAIKLEVSKTNLSFPSSGGNESITVNTNAVSYSVNVLPYWCSVEKYSGYFVITCVENSINVSRTDYFTVSAGNKTVRVNVSQSSATIAPKGTLRVTKESLIFSSSGGSSEVITVYSNSGSYSISLVPWWCTVQQNSDSFFVSCKANRSKKTRSNWFKVSDGYNELIISVSQAGK